MQKKLFDLWNQLPPKSTEVAANPQKRKQSDQPEVQPEELVKPSAQLAEGNVEVTLYGGDMKDGRNHPYKCSCTPHSFELLLVLEGANLQGPKKCT